MKYVNFDTLIDLFDEVESKAEKDNLFFVAGVVSGLKKYIKEELPTVEIEVEIENEKEKNNFDFRFKI